MNASKPPGFLPNFCLHVLLPNTLLGVLALVSGVIGGEFGVPYLVWHDDPIKQFWVGFALALVALEALYIGMLLWGKKVGRLDRLGQYPQVAEWITAGIFWRYSLWVVGQLGVLVALVAALVLLVQEVDRSVQDRRTDGALDTADMFAQAPPPPNYAVWLPVGAVAAATTVFLGGWLAKQAIRALVQPGESATVSRLMAWLIRVADEQPPPPAGRGLLLALWSARTHGSRMRRLRVALFNQTLGVAVGVVFAAAWDISNLPVALGVGASLAFLLVAVRADWLDDVRVFRLFLLVLGCLAYFVVTWLGSRPWCGWPGALLVAGYLAVVLPIGAHAAFPGPASRLLHGVSQRIIASELCRRYPFHLVALLFFLFGLLVLFVVPMTWVDVQSPMVLGCFLLFVVLAVYGFVAYVIDDALPYLVPALLAMVVLSGLPGYKMQFPGLEYTGRPAAGKPMPLLDLEAAVQADLRRKREFEAALAREAQAPWTALVAGGACCGFVKLPDEDPDRLWQEVEAENRVLPGKTTRPAAGFPTRAGLLSLPEIPFRSVPLTTEGRTRPPQPTAKKPLVIVVASGGGIRAAAWTFLVLAELEARFAEEGIPFPYHIRLITGASGGMLGASYYVRSLRPPEEMTWGPDRRAELVGPGGRFDKLTQDWLTPIVERMVLNDVPAFFSPFPVPTDRGIALEQAWSRGLEGELDVTFADLAERERDGWCPSLVFSPMMIEDGRRLLISNLDLRYPVSNDGHLLGYEFGDRLGELNRNYSHEALELFRLFPEARRRFALSTAIRMSASFPYFSPAVPLPTRPRRRIVDAGYYDNYGVSLASAFLFSGKNRAWFQENVSKIVVVQIRDGASDDERRLEEIPDARRRKGIDSLLSRALEELTSPLEGLGNARVSTSSFRNDGLLELLNTYFELLRREPPSGQLAQAQRYFTVVNFEFPNHVSLSWHLSKREKQQMRKPFEDPNDDAAALLQSRIAALLEWWKADVYEPPPESDPPGRSRIAGTR